MFLKPILNKWQGVWQIQKENRSGVPGWRVVTCGILNFKTMPKEGEIVKKDSYDGFLLTFLFWLPYEKC